MHSEIKHLLTQLREGQSLRGDMTTEVIKLLRRVHDIFEGNIPSGEVETRELLILITKKQNYIMDQNAALNTALDKLGADLSAELKIIAGMVTPGMTDDQVNATVARINALDATVLAVLPAAPVTE